MIIQKLAKEFHIKISQVENTVQLIDDCNTIPFIARYRKEMTGGLSDVTLRDLHERLLYLRNLEERKQEVIRLIEEQGKLTEELKEEIISADVLQRVEDLYRPYKQKKSTRATKAKERGLEPLAYILIAQEITEGSIEELAAVYVNEEKEVHTIEDAIFGALDIIAEQISDNPEFRDEIRTIYLNEAVIVSEAADSEEKTVYEMYYNYSEAVSKIPNHRILALNRGENEKKLKVKVQAPSEQILYKLNKNIITNPKSIFVTYLEKAIEDSYKRLIAPSMEREIRSLLFERAEKEAVKVFAKNTENLLMTPPVRNVKVMGVDPSYRTGCKITILDETGKLLDFTTIYPNPPQNDIEKSKTVTKELVNKYNIDVIAIGNGTASRETEKFIAETLKEVERKVYYTIVSEAGASVYSASKLATEEYPDLDVTTRGSLSIGRRLQDPLAELVKIDPKHIGVGQYQHDINQTMLNSALTNVVEDCVNRVGVDLNTASPSLLQYISGINSGIAKNIVKYREEKGKFTERKQLMKVSKLGEKAFEQCAGFLRIADGLNALDATAVHPESYSVAEQLMQLLGVDHESIRQGGNKKIEEKIIEFAQPEPITMGLPSSDKKMKSLQDMEEIKGAMHAGAKKITNEERIRQNLSLIAEKLNIGLPTLEDIVKELIKPGRDPREEMPEVIFRNDVLKLEDLKLGMELTGTVRNVVDFGAFVDIGIKNDGLVHISQISENYIKHPMQAVSVGDTVKVKIIDIDYERERVSLSMKNLNN
ncbi:MAG: RNA-binding transcriptional accessory protein [Clostridiales bacterium]|nr:RNA-binding transcriptional accessory protein [Clostridiales bacterium]